MKRIHLLLLVALAAATFSGRAFAQRVDIGLQSSIVYQALSQENDNGTLPELAPGFQNAIGNIILRAHAFEGGEVAVDLFLSSKHHNEMYGYQGYFHMTQLPQWMKLGAVNEIYAKHFTVKAGQFTIGYGDGHLYQSINGDVLNNELVGNAVVRAALTTLGMEATFRGGPIELLAGLSNGTTKGDIQKGKGLAVHTRLTALPIEGVRLSLSGYRVDHSANGNGYPGTGTKSYLYQGGDRAGSRYDIWNGLDGGEIFLGKGEDETSVQFDVRMTLGRALVYGMSGWYRDADINGTTIDTASKTARDNGDPEDQWRHYMVTARYDFTDWLYVAGRYSTASAVMLSSTDTDGIVKRMQVGAGFRLAPNIVLKAEYVSQSAEGFPAGYMNNRTNLGLSPSFQGVTVETAIRL